MNNTGKKIAILASSILAAVVGILVFYNTIISPPIDPDMENLHYKDLSECIDRFSTLHSYKYNDSVYVVAVDKINLYQREQFLNNQEIDQQVKSLVQKYHPVFRQLCLELFNASIWFESDHTAMRKRISELKQFTINDGATTLVTDIY